MSDYQSGSVKLDEDEVLKTFRSRFNQSKQHSKDWREEAKTLYDLRAGHQWSPEDEAALKTKYQNSYPMVTFNLADKYNDAISGMQINNRQDIKFFPRKQGQVAIDEYATGAVKWNRDQCEAEDEETDAFGDVFWTGMAWIEHFLDDTENPDGWIAQERRDPMEMYWDPMARKKNLADRRYQIRIKPMTRAEYKDFFGEEEADGANFDNVGQEFSDEGTPQEIPVPHDYGTGKEGSQSPKPIYVADYQFLEMEDRYTVTALFPGETEPQTQSFLKDEWSNIKSALDRNGIQYKVTETRTKCFYRAWIAGDQIKQVGKDKIKKITCGSFTYEAITGKRDRNTNTWYGMGRNIKDPQLWVNKFFSNILHTLSVNAKGGLMAEEGAFEDQAKAERSWANPASITFTADGAIQNQRVMPKPPATYPQGMDRLMTFALEAMPMTSGLNPEVLGLTQRDQPNVLEESRKRSAMAIIAWAFDAMRRYYKRSGKLMLAMIKEYLSEGQLIKIFGPQGAQYVPLLKNQLATDYDVIVDESPTSTNMQERMWSILLQMIPLAIQAQIPIPPEVIDYSPLSEDLKQKWKQRLQPNPQQQTMEQLQQQKATADIKVTQSKDALQRAQAFKATVDANVAKEKAPIDAALAQVEAVRKASEAGAIQAGA